MAENSPAFQWYPKDALGSTRLLLLSLAEEGAYRRALDLCWINGSLPSDPNKLIKIIGKGCSIKIAKAIIPMFEEVDGCLYHERLEKERIKQASFREKQAENGKRGGRPKLNPDETQNKGLGYSGETQIEPKKSSSSLSSITSTKEKEKYISEGGSFENKSLKAKEKPPLSEDPPEIRRLNEWLETNASSVLKMTEQLTLEQYQSLYSLFHETEILSIFQSMHNYKPLLKNNKSVYLTAKNWIERDKQRKPVAQNGQPKSKVSQNVQNLLDYAKRNP